MMDANGGYMDVEANDMDELYDDGANDEDY